MSCRLPGSRRIPLVSILGITLAPALAPAAEEDVLRRELDALRAEMRAQQQRYEQRIEALQRRIETVEARAPAPPAAPRTAPGPDRTPAAAPAGTFRTPAGAFQIGVSGTAAAGGSSVPNDALAGLQFGDHDPQVNGFTIQSIELFVGGAVDPYFDAQATFAFQIDAEGETKLELEEAFATTRGLPAGLQVKAGQYFTEFGRANVQHVHQWSFVDQPVAVSRLLGFDGLRSQGARVSWLLPAPWYSELIVGAQNAKGETVSSFLGEEGEEVGGHVLRDRETRNFGDLLYSARWLQGFDIGPEWSVNWGVSGLYGPNATGSDTETWIAGTDLFAKWQPAATQRGFPFVSVQGELMYRNFEAGDRGDPDRETLEDVGLYVQGDWGFRPGWVAGLRFEYAEGDGDNSDDPLRDQRFRLSPALTWFPTEFSKIRLQYNRDWAEHLAEGSADTVWLQLEYSLGGHFAHTF